MIDSIQKHAALTALAAALIENGVERFSVNNNYCGSTTEIEVLHDASIAQAARVDLAPEALSRWKFEVKVIQGSGLIGGFVLDTTEPPCPECGLMDDCHTSDCGQRRGGNDGTN